MHMQDYNTLIIQDIHLTIIVRCMYNNILLLWYMHWAYTVYAQCIKFLSYSSHSSYRVEQSYMMLLKEEM